MVLYYYHPYISGVSVYAKKLAEEFVHKGYKVTVLTSRYDKKIPKKEYINGVLVIRRPVLLKLGKGVIMPTFWYDVIKYSKKNDFVNAHLPMPDTGISSLFIPKKKIVTTYQCDISLQNGLLNRLIVSLSFALMRLQLRRSSSITTLSSDYFRHSKMSRYINKTHQIYPIISASEFKYTNPSNLIKDLNLNSGEVKIGFMGRIVYEKGIKYLLGSIPYLSKHLKNFKIIIAGDYKNIAGGSIKGELDKYIKLYPDKIIFTGYLREQDKNKFYSMLDVFVLPSIDPLEAFGIVQVEALLCGTPVVASNLPGVREVVSRTGYGLLAKPRNPEEIAKNILKILNHDKKYKPCRNKVLGIFNPKHTMESYASLLED